MNDAIKKLTSETNLGVSIDIHTIEAGDNL